MSLVIRPRTVYDLSIGYLLVIYFCTPYICCHPSYIRCLFICPLVYNLSFTAFHITTRPAPPPILGKFVSFSHNRNSSKCHSYIPFLTPHLYWPFTFFPSITFISFPSWPSSSQIFRLRSIHNFILSTSFPSWFIHISNFQFLITIFLFLKILLIVPLPACLLFLYLLYWYMVLYLAYSYPRL